MPGPTGQASIVAYNNLYSGCGGTVPSVYRAHYIGAGSAIQSSPVFSLDGGSLLLCRQMRRRRPWSCWNGALQLLRLFKSQCGSALPGRTPMDNGGFLRLRCAGVTVCIAVGPVDSAL